MGRATCEARRVAFLAVFRSRRMLVLFLLGFASGLPLMLTGQTLQAWLTRLVAALHGRIHGFNVSVAHVWAEQERLLDKVGQRMPVEDSYIAATARRHGLTIATGNDRDFKRPGLKVFNPFKELP